MAALSAVIRAVPVLPILSVRRGLARVFIKYPRSDKPVIYTLIGTGSAAAGQLYARGRMLILNARNSNNDRPE